MNATGIRGAVECRSLPLSASARRFAPNADSGNSGVGVGDDVVNNLALVHDNHAGSEREGFDDEGACTICVHAIGVCPGSV